MKNRNPLTVFFLSLLTLGIYSIVWSVKTKNEMNKKGASIPTAWLIIVPFVCLYWYWKYAEGVEMVTNGKQSQTLAFVLIVLLGIVGNAVIQSDFNKIGTATPDVPAVGGFNLYAQPATVGPVAAEAQSTSLEQPQQFGFTPSQPDSVTASTTPVFTPSPVVTPTPTPVVSQPSAFGSATTPAPSVSPSTPEQDQTTTTPQPPTTTPTTQV